MIKVRLELLSDMHIGSGLSDGTVDADFDRDSSGRPRMKGSVLKGLLRESCLDLLECLGDSVADGPALLELVFGRAEESPGQGNILFPFLCAEIGEKKSVVTGHTQVSMKTGTAEEGKLFLAAHAPAGLCFEGTLQDYALPKAQRGRAIALLSLGLLNLEGIGGKRRTGKGKVKARPADWFGLSSDDLQQEVVASIGVLKSKGDDSSVGNGPCRIPESLPLTDIQSSSQVCTIDVLFTASAPVCLPDGPPAGNRFGCLDYIPSVAVAGVFFNRLKGLGYSADEIEKLIAANAISFPALLPLPLGEQSGPEDYSLPWPLSLERCKKARGEASHHFADALGKVALVCPTCGGGVGPESGKYIQVSTDSSKFGGITKELTLHNRIDRETQTTGEAGVFTQEVLPEWTVFQGRLFFSSAEVRTFWKSVMCPRGEAAVVAFGKGRSRGYGQGTLKYCDTDETALSGFSARCKGLDSPTFALMFVSPGIVLDDWLSLQSAPDGKHLALAVGKSEAFCELLKEEGSVFSRSENLFLFNSHRLMPEFPESVLTPGSIFRYRWNENIPNDARVSLLAKLEQCGIGERRNLGFGRIMVNPLAGFALENLERTEIEPEIRSARLRVSENAVRARAVASKFIKANRFILASLPKPSQMRSLQGVAGGELEQKLKEVSQRAQEKPKWLCMVHDPETNRNLTFREYLEEFAGQFSTEGIGQFIQVAQEADNSIRMNIGE